MPSAQSLNVEGPRAAGPEIRRGGTAPLPNPFAEDLDAAAKALRDVLNDTDPRIRIYAARSITLAATHIQRTNAYLKRCEVLNERTQRLPKPNEQNSSAPSATGVHTPWRAVNPSPDPEDHLTLPKDATFRDHHVHFLGPKPKTKADYARMATLALNKLHERDAEQAICNEELIVYRAYDNGSLNLATRNHHLNDIRTKHPSRELSPARGVNLPPDSSLLIQTTQARSAPRVQSRSTSESSAPPEAHLPRAEVPESAPPPRQSEPPRDVSRPRRPSSPTDFAPGEPAPWNLIRHKGRYATQTHAKSKPP